jgi:hypothetical protein
MGEIDLLLATLPEEFLHLVTTIGKGGGFGWRGFFRCRFN